MPAECGKIKAVGSDPNVIWKLQSIQDRLTKRPPRTLPTTIPAIWPPLSPPPLLDDPSPWLLPPDSVDEGSAAKVYPQLVKSVLSITRARQEIVSPRILPALMQKPDPTLRLTPVTTTLRGRGIAKRTQLVRGRSIPAIPLVRISLDTRFRIVRSQGLEDGQRNELDVSALVGLWEQIRHMPI